MADKENADNENPERPADEEVRAADPGDEASEAPPAPVTAPGETEVPAMAPRTPAPRLRDQVFTFRSMVAVAVATLLLGGAGGAALVAVTSDGDHDGRRFARIGDGPGRFGDDQGRRFPNGPGGGRNLPPRLQQNSPGDAPDSSDPGGSVPPSSGSAS